MSIIQTDTKAVTEEQGQEMIARTLAMPDPLGIPTLFLHPDDFSSHWLEMLPNAIGNRLYQHVPNKTIERELSDKIVSFETASGLSPKKAHLMEPEETSTLQSDVEDLAQGILRAKLNPNDLGTTNALTYQSQGIPPHMMVPLAYEDPSRSVVTISKVQTAEQMHATFFHKSPKDLSPRPGLNTAYKFNALWHEIGHGTGATEPQTETIAAIATRKAFADSNVVKAQADVRAVRAILRGQNKRHAEINEDDSPERQKYGWPMVEANDYVAGLSEETIDALDEQQVKQIRHQAFDHLGELVNHLSILLERKDPEAFRDADFAALDYAAAQHRQDAEQGGAGEQYLQVLTRFQLAARRLHVGAPAYQEGTNHVDQHLLESEQAQPLTFTPGEFIPEDAPEV